MIKSPNTNLGWLVLPEDIEDDLNDDTLVKWVTGYNEIYDKI